MLITFDHSDHTYTLNGVEKPSVTTVIGAEGITDYGYADESDRQRGSYVHEIAAMVARNWKGSTVEEIVANSRWDPSGTREDLVGYGYGAAKFVLESGFRPVLLEQVVGSEKLGICGTLDAYGPEASKLNWLVDFKSGAPQEGAHIQTALYAYCLEETLGHKTDQRVVVWLKKDGEYKLAGPPRPAGGVDLAVGMAVCTVYRWRKNYRLL